MTRAAPVPVEELDAANAWGLRHMSGNVAELTTSCFTEEIPDLALTSQWQAESQTTGCDLIVRKSMPDARIEVGDWHDTLQITPEISVTLTPANHWSARGIRDRRMALWSGFMINSPKSQIWFAGDTGYGDGALFRDIRKRHERPDIAIIPIGVYEPRRLMSDQHLAPDESVRVV